MTVLGIDIGGTRIKAGIVDGDGAIATQTSVSTPANLADFRAAIQTVVRQLAPAAGSIIGVGIGCKGIINPESTKVELSPGSVQFLEGLRLSEIVRPALGSEVPILADNDARIALIGEALWGAARGCKNVVMLTLGTGVGGAVMSHGVILRGATGAAGHLGHVTVETEGPRCMCGNYGCLETLFSARTIEGEAYSHVRRGCATKLAERQPLTCQAVFDLAAEGDEVAAFIVRRGTRKLGAALAGLLHVFDPERVIVGGQIAGAGSLLLDPLRAEVSWRSKGLLGREVPIVTQQVADRSGIVGAAAMVLLERS